MNGKVNESVNKSISKQVLQYEWSWLICQSIVESIVCKRKWPDRQTTPESHAYTCIYMCIYYVYLYCLAFEVTTRMKYTCAGGNSAAGRQKQWLQSYSSGSLGAVLSTQSSNVKWIETPLQRHPRELNSDWKTSCSLVADPAHCILCSRSTDRSQRIAAVLWHAPIALSEHIGDNHHQSS